MVYVYIILMLLLIGVLIKYISYLNEKNTEPVILSEEKINTFHIFPDYSKNMPYECKAGEKLKFIVKGYSDREELKEVLINSDAVIWKYTKGNGEFRGNKNLKTGIFTGTSIHFITPEIADPYKKEILLFISAHYMGLTDATWIKIVR